MDNLFAEIGQSLLKDGDTSSASLKSEGQEIFNENEFRTYRESLTFTPNRENSANLPDDFEDDCPDFDLFDVRIEEEEPDEGDVPVYDFSQVIPTPYKAEKAVMPVIKSSESNNTTCDIVAEGNLTINNHITGNVIVSGTLTVNGKVTGNVKAHILILNGKIEGDVDTEKFCPTKNAGFNGKLKTNEFALR